MIRFLIFKAVFVLAFFSSLSAFADDVDIFVKTSSKEANVLFILDGSASMKEIVPGTSKTRMQVMQDTLKSVLATAPDYLSVGLSSYGTNDSYRSWDTKGNYPNGIKFPVTPINELVKPIILSSITVDGTAEWDLSSITQPSDTVTVRDFVGDIAANWTPFGHTPIVDALYEAARYYRGEGLKYGYDTAYEKYSSHPATYVRHAPPATVEVKPLKSFSNDIKDVEGCNEISELIVSDPYIDDFDNGDTTYGGKFEEKRCPTDRFNPAAPALASNCALTKHNCQTNTYPTCLEYNPDTCSSYDENGDCAVFQSGGCKTYGADITTNSCYFSTCKQVLKPAPKYISPIVGECKSNNIILMSDGEPAYSLSDYWDTYPNSADNKDGTGVLNDEINNIIGSTPCIDKPSGFASGKCGPELTHYLATHDNAPGDKIPGDQFVDTLVIGFSSGISTDAENYLKSLVTLEDDPATSAREGYFSATDEVELANAFKQAIQSIKLKDKDTYSTATYSIQTASSLTHGSYAYIPVFEDTGGASWVGNLKKYEVIKGQLYGINAKGEKLRATTDNGNFVESVHDLWSSNTTLASKVGTGGAANLIIPSLRKVFTNTSSSIITINEAKNEQLNASTSQERNDLISFIKGENADGTARHHMGDIIHSKPVQLITSSNDSILFIGTNEGYLHAIRASTGEEVFAFMPRQLLKNIKPQFLKTAVSEHIYGVDGQITLWHDDTNHNGIKEDNEKAYVFFGLRRGGKAYYALDVSKPSAPKLLWEINDSSFGFDKLGFTWSKPKLEMLKYQTNALSSLTAKPVPVLVFGGGYIDDHSNDSPAGTAVGVYIVDALSGDFLYKFTDTDMGAVPGGVRSLDIDRNGSIDRMYFSDTKGYVWRVDLNASKTAPYNLEETKIYKLASLGGTGSDNRAFFVEPDVAFFKHKGKYAISVSLGSGLRPDPLNTNVEDYFFMLLDKNIFDAPPTSQAAITLADLMDAPVSGTDLVNNLSKADSKKGWKLKLSSTENPTGEKVFSPALTYQNKILFTTFSAKPEEAVATVLDNTNTTACGTAIINTAKLYVMDLLSGGAVLDLDNNKKVDSNDIWTGIGAGKIPETPQIRYNGYAAKGGGNCTANDCVRQQSIKAADKTVALPPDNKLPRVYWINRDR